jgi:glycosyltransferase involved in cell wall biosynthesis
MAKLSLCMIVKDEAFLIRRCLESVRDVTDEIIVIDTGSTDDTPQIAAEFGAQVHHIPWQDNFSEARNHSLELASGDWILFLDADEELAVQSKDILRQVINDDQNEGYLIKILNRIDDENWNEVRPDLVFRLFKNRPEYRFQNAIHEQITDSILDQNPQAQFKVCENIIIWHDGFRKQLIKAKDKRNRNLRLLYRELEWNPTNSMLRFHYGEELFIAKQYREALIELKKASEGVDPHTHYVPKLLRYIITAHLVLEEHGTAIQMIKYGLSHLPFFADLHYIGGLASLGIGDFSQARVYFQNATHTPEQPAHYSSVSGTRGFLSYYQLGKIAEEFLNYDEALQQYTKSYQDNRNFIPALEKIVYLLNPRMDPGRARTAFEQIADFNSPAASLQLGIILFRQSAFVLASKYLEKGKNAPHAPAETDIWLAVCWYQQHHAQKSMAILNGYAPEEPQFLPAAFDLFLNYWLQKDLPQVEMLGKTLVGSNLAEDIKKLVYSLQSTLAEYLTDTLPEVNGYDPETELVLGDEGIAAFRYVLIRALDLAEKGLADLLVKKLSPEQVGKQAKNIGELFRNYGYFDSAAACFKRYLQDNPASGETYYCLAKTCMEDGKLLEAMNYYRLALAYNKNSVQQEPRYYQALIRSYQTMRQEVIKEALKNFPDEPLLSNPQKEDQYTCNL